MNDGLQRITEAEIDAIAIGAGVLGTGGGGSTYLSAMESRVYLRKYGGLCPVIQVDELEDEAIVCTVSVMGAPTVGVEKMARGDEVSMACRAWEEHTGKKMVAIGIAEIGGGNGLTPIPAALQLGLPLIDGDSMGRAFPELQMDTLMIGGVSPVPFVLGDCHGNTAIFNELDSPKRAEEYARNLTIEMGGSAALVMPVTDGATLKRHLIRGTLTLSWRLGNIVLECRANGEDPAEQVAAAANGFVLYRGKIADVFRRTVKGFARGRMRIASLDHEQEELVIDFQNENLIAVQGGETLCTVPDLISLLTLEEGEPVGTEAIRYGLRVAVLAMPAPKELKTPAALASVGPAAFGYPDVEFQALPGDLL